MIKLLNILKETQSKFRIDKSSIHGEGLFTNVDIPLNTKVLAIGDVTRDPKYILTSYGKKINHSPNPNIEIKIIDDIAYIYSIKPIKANDELVADYTKLPEPFDRSTKFLNELEINNPNKIKAEERNENEIFINDFYFMLVDNIEYIAYGAGSKPEKWEGIIRKYPFIKIRNNNVIIPKDNVRISPKNIKELEINKPEFSDNERLIIFLNKNKQELIDKLISKLIIRRPIQNDYPIDTYQFKKLLYRYAQFDIDGGGDVNIDTENTPVPVHDGVSFSLTDKTSRERNEKWKPLEIANKTIYYITY